jgi:hypothetical protein
MCGFDVGIDRGQRGIFACRRGRAGRSSAFACKSTRGIATGGVCLGEVHQPVSETLAFPYRILL